MKPWCWWNLLSFMSPPLWHGTEMKTLRCTALLPGGEMRRMWWKFVYLYTASGFYIHFFYRSQSTPVRIRAVGKTRRLPGIIQKEKPTRRTRHGIIIIKAGQRWWQRSCIVHTSEAWCVCVCVFTWLCSSLCCLSLRFSGVSATMVNDVLG